MGTRLDAVFIDIDEKYADILLSGIKNKLEEIENILSIYRPDSELSILNRTAHKQDVVVSRYLYNAISECMNYYILTDRVFDAGRAKLTGYIQGVGKNESEELKEMLETSGMELVELKKEGSIIRYHGKNVKIDSGGFGKGLAIREVKRILLSGGVENALVSFGESSVLALGSHPHGNHWPVAIANIFDRKTAAKVTRISNSSISTSGTGFVDASGLFKPAGNIFKPITGEPVDDPRTVSFISDDPLEAEILSTALLIDSECLPADYDRSGKEAFAVMYDSRNNFIVNEIF